VPQPNGLLQYSIVVAERSHSPYYTAGALTTLASAGPTWTNTPVVIEMSAATVTSAKHHHHRRRTLLALAGGASASVVGPHHSRPFQLAPVCYFLVDWCTCTHSPHRSPWPGLTRIILPGLTPILLLGLALHTSSSPVWPYSHPPRWPGCTCIHLSGLALLRGGHRRYRVRDHCRQQPGGGHLLRVRDLPAHVPGRAWQKVPSDVHRHVM